MDTNIRIAELLGWTPIRVFPYGTREPGHGFVKRLGYWQTGDGEELASNFTTDLNLTVREIERKKTYSYMIGRHGTNRATAMCYSPSLPSPGSFVADTPAEALALAFLAALES